MFGLKSRQVFYLTLLAAFIYAGTKFFPIYLRANQFSDYVYQEVKFAASNRKTTEKVRAKIMTLAEEYEIPITPRDILITKRGPTFTVEINYELPVDLYVYQRQLHFRVMDSGALAENDRN